MKPVQTENSLVFANAPAFWRGIGVLFFALAITFFLFAYYGASYFGSSVSGLTSTLGIVGIILGIVFAALGAILISIPSQKLEVNSAARKFSFTEKLVKTSFEEFSFDDVEMVELFEHGFENNTLYIPQIVLRGGKIIKVPSNKQGDEKEQTEVFEQIRKLLSK